MPIILMTSWKIKSQVLNHLLHASANILIMLEILKDTDLDKVDLYKEYMDSLFKKKE